MMSKHGKEVLIFCIAVATCYSIANAQSYYSNHEYSVADGLPTELVKSVAKDSIGYLWIASDEGLAKFDGRNFTHYPNALPSIYAKKIFKTKKGRLLVLSDFGLTQINSNLDTAYFIQLLRGARAETDSTLLYPKSIYEDGNGNLWISEPASVVKYSIENGAMKRFLLPEQFMSDSFVRSFSFFTLANNLYIFSINGGVFRYDELQSLFEQQHLFESFNDITSTVPINDSTLLLSCNQGFFEISKKTDHWESNQILKELENVGQINLSNNQLFIAAENSNFYRIDTTEYGLNAKKIDEFYMVNEIYIDHNEIWLSGDEGLQLLKRKEFMTIEMNNQNLFIEAIENVDNQYSYFAYKEGLYKLNKLNNSVEKIYGSSIDYFLSISFADSVLWVSSGDKIYQFVNDQLINKIDLSDRGDYIFNIQVDEEGELWFTQDNVSGISRLNSENEIEHFQEKNGIMGRITVSALDRDNNLILGGTTGNGYLYEYNRQNNLFENISHTLYISGDKDFEVFDIAVDSDNNYWLGTSIGLIRHNSSKVELIEIDEKFRNLSVKAIEIIDNQLWFTNSFGIVKYNMMDGVYVILDESTGLPSKDVSSRCIKVDNANTIWVGTSKGITYYKLIEENFITKKPIVQQLFVNGKQESISNSFFGFDEFFELIINSFHYPSELVEYQYKLASDQSWKQIDKNGRIVLSGLTSGNHTLLLRAKTRSSFNWSEVRNYEFEIAKPWYNEGWFIGLMVIVVVLLILSGFSISSAYTKKQKLVLKQMVDKQTKELLSANEKLTRTNKELDMFVYSASHDLRAPLSSIIGLTGIMRLEKDDKSKEEIISKIDSSVARLDNFVQDVINYSKNSRLNVEISSFDPLELTHDVIESMKYNEEAKTIAFNVTSSEPSPINTDKKRLQILLNNLISNGIRYSDVNKNDRFINVHFEFGDQLLIIVKDNGVGIPKEHKDKIYNMFYRASESSSGSGLGLYIVSEIISSLNGNINIETEVGVGTEFKILLPNFDSTSI